jgi:hypothetical protein
VLGDVPRLGAFRRPRVGLGGALACGAATSPACRRPRVGLGGGLAYRAATSPACRWARLLGWVIGARGAWGTVLFFFIAPWGTVGLAKRGLV